MENRSKKKKQHNLPQQSSSKEGMEEEDLANMWLKMFNSVIESKSFNNKTQGHTKFTNKLKLFLKSDPGR